MMTNYELQYQVLPSCLCSFHISISAFLVLSNEKKDKMPKMSNTERKKQTRKLEPLGRQLVASHSQDQLCHLETESRTEAHLLFVASLLDQDISQNRNCYPYFAHSVYQTINKL